MTTISISGNILLNRSGEERFAVAFDDMVQYGTDNRTLTHTFVLKTPHNTMLLSIDKHASHRCTDKTKLSN